MQSVIRELRREELLVEHGGYFDADNAERCAKWLVASEGRKPVLLIGAGYSLNATDVETGSYASRAQAPLWSDVVSRLAVDVDLRKEDYDAPTLFELYGEALGEAKLRDALRACFADSALRPGPAHEAIADYPSEAIITTNCLDTLLDRVCLAGWRRVVEDSDLSIEGPLRDLIYLHGHREYADSWVMTRSQYEDFPRTRPVIVARTRQLLAQHPLLIVGFGMTDPNFHSITRLLGRDMRARQPLSLVLMPSLPSVAERLHWRGLGFEIVAPRKGVVLPDFFTWALRSLKTAYSPTSEAAKAYVSRATSVPDRLRRFRDVNPLPITDRGEAYRSWEHELFSLLTQESRSEAIEVAKAMRRSGGARSLGTDGTGTIGLNYASPSRILRTPILRALEEEAGLGELFLGDANIEFLDRLLTGADVDVLQLAEHFEWAVQAQLFEYSRHRPIMEVLSIHLAKSSRLETKRFEKLLRGCFSLVRKYESLSVEQVLLRHLPPGVLSPDPDPDSKEPHLVEAKAGFRCLLNEEYGLAAAHYANAARAATIAKLELEAWAYTIGEADALESLQTDTAHARSLRERAERMWHGDTLKHWSEVAANRTDEALQEVIYELRRNEHYRLTGEQGLRWSSAIDRAWRSFRDLETCYAPPSKQREYLRPISQYLDAKELGQALPILPAPRDWIESLLEKAPRSLSERKARDQELMDAVLVGHGEPTKAGRVASIAVLPCLVGVFRREDVSRSLNLIGAAVSAHPETFAPSTSGLRPAAEMYWSAFSACAHWSPAKDALIVAQSLCSHGSDFDTAAASMSTLPWEFWCPTMEDIDAVGFISALARLLPSQPSGPRRCRRYAYVFLAFVRMLRAGVAPTALEHLRRASADALEQIKAVGKSQTRHSEAKRLGCMLEMELRRHQVLGTPSLESTFMSWFSDDEYLHGDEGDPEEAIIALVDLGLVGIRSSEMLRRRFMSKLLKFLDDDQHIRRYEMNPHLSHSVVGFLTLGLHLSPESGAKICDMLLRLLRGGAEGFGDANGALVEHLWERSKWISLRGILAAYCGGGMSPPSGARNEDSGAQTRNQLAMLELCASFSGESLSSEQAELLVPLRMFAVASVNDERLAIAHAAAVAVTLAAENISSDSESELYSTAVLRIAQDPRAEVRGTLARNGLAILTRGKSPLLRDAARAAIHLLRDDPSAQVGVLLERAELKERLRSKSLPGN